jgi:hypothetical protein
MPSDDSDSDDDDNAYAHNAYALVPHSPRTQQRTCLLEVDEPDATDSHWRPVYLIDLVHRHLQMIIPAHVFSPDARLPTSPLIRMPTTNNSFMDLWFPVRTVHMSMIYFRMIGVVRQRLSPADFVLDTKSDDQ